MVLIIAFSCEANTYSSPNNYRGANPFNISLTKHFMKVLSVKRVVKDRFTKEYTEQKLREGKRDHSGEELFVNELRLHVDQFPAEEVRVFHLTQAERKHDPSLMKTKQGLADTIKKQREKENAKFRNTWLLEPL